LKQRLDFADKKELKLSLDVLQFQDKNSFKQRLDFRDKIGLKLWLDFLNLREILIETTIGFL